MATQDTACTLGPYFKIHAGKIDEFKKLAEQFVATTQTEAKYLYYGFALTVIKPTDVKVMPMQMAY